MNFLQSISSAVISASSAALSGSNNVPGLSGYTLGERVASFDGKSIWTLYLGIKKDDSTAVSVFGFDVNAPSPSSSSSSSYGSSLDKRSQLVLAKNAFRKLRALRHPNVLKFLDGSETDSQVWIVTELVESLSTALASATPATSLTEESKVYGLLHVSNALSFLNKDGQSIHGNLRPESVWLTQGGEFRLGGLEVCTRKDDDAAVIWTSAGFVPSASVYVSPEVRRYGWATLKDHEPTAALDPYQMHLFIHVLFNGPLPSSFYGSSDQAPTLPATRGSIPASIFQAWRRLGNPNPRARLKTDVFLELGNGSQASGGGWWPANRLVKLTNALEGLGLASDGEKAALMRTLKDVDTQKGGIGSLPSNFLRYKVLPSLVHNFEYGGGGPALLPVILALAANLNEKEYQASIIQPLVRMFAIPDRAMRMALLEGLDKFADKLSNKDVAEKIWPHFMTGFGDVVPVIREATVKSVLLLAPKLPERTLNNDLLRQLARVQTDGEPGIRTNTCILLGRLSKLLQPSTNRKVLIPAFARALRDPFVHARMAGLMALMATTDCYEKEDIAGKVIPSMSICLIDREKIVRDQAYKAIDMFVKKCETLTASMPETMLEPSAAPNGVPAPLQANNQSQGSQASRANTSELATNAASAARALAGWAFASASNKLSAAEANAPINPVFPTAGHDASANGTTRPPVASSEVSSRAASISSDQARSDFVEAEDWGGDLMDVNDDDGDWNDFETGTTPSAPKFDPIAARLSTTKPKTSTLGAKKGPLKLGSASRSSALRIPMDMDATDSWDLDESTPKKAPIAKPVARPAASRPGMSSPTKKPTLTGASSTPAFTAPVTASNPAAAPQRIGTPPLGGRKQQQPAQAVAAPATPAAARSTEHAKSPPPVVPNAAVTSPPPTSSANGHPKVASPRASLDSSLMTKSPPSRPLQPTAAAAAAASVTSASSSPRPSLDSAIDSVVNALSPPRADSVQSTTAPAAAVAVTSSTAAPVSKEERAARLAAAREERKARLAAAKQKAASGL